MNTFIVRKIRFTPEREEGRPRVVNCIDPHDAPGLANIPTSGGLRKRGDGVWQADGDFNVLTMSTDIVEVIPA